MSSGFLKIGSGVFIALSLISFSAQGSSGQLLSVSDSSDATEEVFVMSREVPLSQGRNLMEVAIIAVQKKSYFSNDVSEALERNGWKREIDNTNHNEADIGGRLIMYADGRVLIDCDSLGRVEKTPTVRSPMAISHDSNAIVQELDRVFEQQIHDTVEILSRGK